MLIPSEKTAQIITRLITDFSRATLNFFKLLNCFSHGQTYSL
jgi:hypothetical protein